MLLHKTHLRSEYLVQLSLMLAGESPLTEGVIEKPSPQRRGGCFVDPPKAYTTAVASASAPPGRGLVNTACHHKQPGP